MRVAPCLFFLPIDARLIRKSLLLIVAAMGGCAHPSLRPLLGAVHEARLFPDSKTLV